MLIIITYIFTRFVYFDVHGMKQLPDTLALLSSALVAFFLISNKTISSISVVLGNVVGFVLGSIFHKSYVDVITGNVDNMWIIWIASYLVIVLLGILIDKMFHMKHKG